MLNTRRRMSSKENWLQGFTPLPSKASKPIRKVSSWLMGNSKTILIATGVLVALGLLVWICFRKRSEHYEPRPVSFLNEQQTKLFLATDEDGYGQQMNKVNLEACGVVSLRDLLDKWSSSASTWTKEEQKKLKDACHIADYAIATRLKGSLSQQMSNIDWKIAKTVYPYYLDGIPHTRRDMIFLTDKYVANSDLYHLASTLVHEKVHVWQRMYPEEMAAWIEEKGFRKYRLIHQDLLQRSNPDVDGYIYSTHEGFVHGVRFLNDKPLDLSTVEYDQKRDHPYELFAYQVQKLANINEELEMNLKEAQASKSLKAT